MLSEPQGSYADDFKVYQSQDLILEQFTSLLMMTLPEPRMDYYESSDFAEIKNGVLGYTDDII